MPGLSGGRKSDQARKNHTGCQRGRRSDRRFLKNDAPELRYTLPSKPTLHADPGRAVPLTCRGRSGSSALLGKLVRAEGLEPSRGCPRRIFLPATVFTATALFTQAAFVVWTIPSPWPTVRVGGRCCPSSLYTFPLPGLARDCQRRFPRIWAVLRPGFPSGALKWLKSVAYTDSATPAWPWPRACIALQAPPSKDPQSVAVRQGGPITRICRSGARPGPEAPSDRPVPCQGNGHSPAPHSYACPACPQAAPGNQGKSPARS